MQGEMPFFESAEDALKAAVQALGGSKKVGAMLWQDKGIDAASRLLLDCLNSGRNEKLEITQVMLIFSKAKEAGCHAPFMWFAGEVGYDAKPITTAEETDRLTSVVENAYKALAEALPRLERIQQQGRAAL